MKLLIFILILVPNLCFSATYYVRTDGGTKDQCVGTTDAAYPGSGTGQACAWYHPFVAIPPSGTINIAGGDTLIIKSGAYKMGYGWDGGATCSHDYPWDCYMQPIPSGTSGNPTRVLGEGWDTETGAKPELWGTERAKMIINLKGSNYVEIQYLDITDHESCVDNTNHSDMACNRSSYPYGDWGDDGITAVPSSNVLLKNLNIHGLTRGIRAGRLTDWTVAKVTLRGNGMAGWDGDVGHGDGESSNSGTITFTDSLIEWNGCIEQYPDKSIAGCFGQESGGYGDGLGTYRTGGDWVFTDTDFLHNTSDGLDLLYHTLGGTITATRIHAEGNAGNQVKVAGQASVSNSVIIGNCNYFTGSDEETGSEYVDDCRAMGNTLALDLEVAGANYAFVNSTITGEGDVLVQSGGTGCDGSEEIVFRNTILKGDEQAVNAGYTGELASYYYAAGEDGDGSGVCGTIAIDIEDSSVYNVKETDLCPNSDNVLCSDPKFTNAITVGHGTIDVTLQSDSPAINKSSLTVGSTVYGSLVVPSTDYLGATRPNDGTIDWGAYEYGGTIPGSGSPLGGNSHMLNIGSGGSTINFN